MELFSDTIRVEENENLGMYFGLPISHKHPTKAQVQFVVYKVGGRLANRKAKFLSKVGVCV